MGAVRHDVPSVDHHVGDIGCRQRRRRRSRRSRRHPRCGSNPGRTATRSARAPTTSSPASDQPSARWPSIGGGSQQAAAARCPAAGDEAFVQFDGAGLFEQVDDGVAVRAEAEQTRPVEQRGCGSDAVAEVTFGGGAEADAGGDASVHVVDVLGRSGGWRARRSSAAPNTPLSRSTAVGVHAVHDQALVDLAGLLGGVDVQWRAVARSPFDDGRHVFDGDAPHGVQRRADKTDGVYRPAAAGTRHVRPTGHRCRHRTAAAARASGEPSDSGTQIAGVEQGEPDAGVGGRRRSRRVPWHSGRRSGRPPAVVVQVVEFADGGDSGERHLRVHGAGELAGSGRG